MGSPLSRRRLRTQPDNAFAADPADVTSNWAEAAPRRVRQVSFGLPPAAEAVAEAKSAVAEGHLDDDEDGLGRTSSAEGYLDMGPGLRLDLHTGRLAAADAAPASGGTGKGQGKSKKGKAGRLPRAHRGGAGPRPRAARI